MPRWRSRGNIEDPAWRLVDGENGVRFQKIEKIKIEIEIEIKIKIKIKIKNKADSARLIYWGGFFFFFQKKVLSRYPHSYGGSKGGSSPEIAPAPA
jgi:hypothetical protein